MFTWHPISQNGRLLSLIDQLLNLSSINSPQQVSPNNGPAAPSEEEEGPRQVQKIPSKMEVAPRFTLLSLFTLLTLIIILLAISIALHCLNTKQ